MRDKKSYDGIFYCGFRTVSSKGFIKIDGVKYKTNNNAIFGTKVFAMQGINLHSIDIYVDHCSAINFLENLEKPRL